MTTYQATDLSDLIKKLGDKPNVINKAAADTINKTSTFAVRSSIDAIIKEVNLQPSYVKKHLKTVARAKYSNLRAVIQANQRGTLLTRYPHYMTESGVKVSVNKTGGYREIKGAKILRGLRGSGATGIAVRNKDAVRIFMDAMSNGKRTPEKSRKLQRIISKARSKPYGMTVLHSRSINQLFTSVRDDIQPDVKKFMSITFLEDFERYNK